jgi:hypothetical protein
VQQARDQTEQQVERQVTLEAPRVQVVHQGHKQGALAPMVLVVAVVMPVQAARAVRAARDLTRVF